MEDNQWHLDKRVPISLILVIILQTSGVLWFAAQLASKVEANTMAIGRISQTLSQQDERVRNNTTSVAVIHQTLINTEKTLDRIDKRLEELNKNLNR